MPVVQRALTALGLAGSALQAGIDCGLARLEAGQPRFSHPLAQAAALEVAVPAQRRLGSCGAREGLGRGRRARALDLAPRRGRRRTGRARLVCAGRRRTGGSGARRAERSGRGVATGDPDGARCGRCVAVALGAGAGSRAGRSRVRGAGPARGVPGPRARRRPARRRRGPSRPAADFAGPARAGRSGAGFGCCADPGSRSGPGGGDVVRGGVCELEPGALPVAVATAEAAVELAGPRVGASATATELDTREDLDRGGGGRSRLSAPAAARRTRRPFGSTPEGCSASARLGLFACWMEDYETARRELERAVALSRDPGLLGGLPLALSALGELEFRLGNWISARPHAEEALRLAEHADQFLHFGHTVLLLLDAVTGDADGAAPTPTSCRRSPPAAGSGVGAARPRRSRPARARPRPPGGGDRSLVAHPRARASAPASRAQLRSMDARSGQSQIRAGLEAEPRSTWPPSIPRHSRRAARCSLAAAARGHGLRRRAGKPPTRSSPRPIGWSPRFPRRSSPRAPKCVGPVLRREAGCRVEAAFLTRRALARLQVSRAVPWAEKVRGRVALERRPGAARPACSQ